MQKSMQINKMENAGIGEEIWGGEGEVMEGLVN
jgi:hypothetical protein